MVATATLGVGTVPAGADPCLPPPQVLLSEVARVAGTASKLWGDIQAVEQADAAAGTSGPGQVLQDMLGAATKDGYQWDCGSSQLTAPAGAPPRTDLPPDTTPPATASGSPATSGGTKAAGGGNIVAGGDGSTGTTVAGPPTPSSQQPSILAAPAAIKANGRGTTTYLLIALAVASGLLIVLVVRRQMARH